MDRQRLCIGSQIITLLGRLKVDLAEQNKLLVPGTVLRVKLTCAEEIQYIRGYLLEKVRSRVPLSKTRPRVSVVTARVRTVWWRRLSASAPTVAAYFFH